MTKISVFFCLSVLIFAFVQCCEIEETRILTETYACNKTQVIWTKEKCMLFFQCDKQIQRVVPVECVRNVSVIDKTCCNGYAKNEMTGQCEDIDECLLTYHNCSSKCVNIPGSYTCNCETGYTLAENNRTCIDINECDNQLLHNCSHYCKNSEGSYICMCPGTLRLLADGRTCEEVVTPPMTSTNIINADPLVSVPLTTTSHVVLMATQISGYRVAEPPTLTQLQYAGIWVGGGFAVLIMIVIVVFAFIYRRNRNHWPWFRIDGSAVWKKPYSRENSIADIINNSTRSKVLDDPSILGLDTSRARVFKRNPNSKPQFATISSSKVAFSTCSAVTGASSVTLMCPNVIAGSDSTTIGTNSAHASVALSERDGNSHIYCELRENSAPISSTPNNLLNNTKNADRPISPCYASLPISEVPLILTPVTSPSPNETCSPYVPKSRVSTSNIYNEA